MHRPDPSCRRFRGMVAGIALLTAACSLPTEWPYENQWNSRDQIWSSETSQVKLRAAQSRIFDTTDRMMLMEAVVATMQDRNFMIEVADEKLGIVTGRFILQREDGGSGSEFSFRDDRRPLVFLRTYRSWAPFNYRDDLVRLTVTVRRRNERQSVVRASAQFFLEAVEDPEPYQAFFRALETSLFLEAHPLEDA